MDAALLRFMSRRVRLIPGIVGEEYSVAGINWDTGKLLLLGHGPGIWRHPDDVELLPEEDEDHE